MPGWLQSIVNFFGGGLSAIWHAFLNVINVVLGIESRDVNNALRYAASIAASLNSLRTAYDDFIRQSYIPLLQWLNTTIDGIIAREANDYNRLVNFINQLSHRSTQDITILANGVQTDIAALIRWILSTIFGPLSKLIAQALAWIGKEGAYVFDLLTHLEKLADLIIAFLWSGWLLLFRKYAGQLVAFILHNWRAWLPGVLPVIEDIITSLF